MSPLKLLHLIPCDFDYAHFCIVSTETPDNVRMSEGNIGQRLVEGRNYSVECAVTNVAPARNLHVSWHFGNKVLQTQTFADSTVSPVNLSSIISVVANRNETGSEIWCEAKLVFEAKAQTLPATRSNSVKANVLCKFSLSLKPIYFKHKSTCFLMFFNLTFFFMHSQIRRLWPVLKPRSWNSHPPLIWLWTAQPQETHLQYTLGNSLLKYSRQLRRNMWTSPSWRRPIRLREPTSARRQTRRARFPKHL